MAVTKQITMTALMILVAFHVVVYILFTKKKNYARRYILALSMAAVFILCLALCDVSFKI